MPSGAGNGGCIRSTLGPVGSDEVGIAVTADGSGAILFSSTPEITPRKAAKHRGSPRVQPFSLEGVEDFFNLIGHWRTELKWAN